MITGRWYLSALLFGVTIGVAIGVLRPAPSCAQVPSGSCGMKAVSAPEDDLQGAILNLLRTSTQSVYCSVGGIDDPRVVRELVALRKNGVDVRILDLASSSVIAEPPAELVAAGVSVSVRSVPLRERSQYCLIDGRTVMTGSWSWRAPALNRGQVTVFKDCPEVYQTFYHTFEWATRVRPVGPESADAVIGR